MKKLLAILLALCMVFPMMPITASAESAVVASGTCGDNLTWVQTEDGTLTISGEGAMMDYEKGYRNPPWGYSVNVVKIVIGEGVTHIGDWAFYNMSNLVEVSLPESLTSIGKSVFERCVKLPEIKLPSGLKEIGIAAFDMCSEFTSLEIPDGVTEIPAELCSMCTKLKIVKFPAQLKSVGNNAFEYCSLTSIELPEGCEWIGKYAFVGNDATEISLPDSIVSVTDFSFVTQYTVKAKLSNGLYALPDNALSGKTALEELILPNCLQTVGNYAFQNCRSLKELSFAETLVSIGTNAFENCTSLSDVYFYGDAPEFAAGTFAAATVTAHYPADNDTWTDDVLVNYGGNVTWIGDVEREETEYMATGTYGDNLTWTLSHEGTLTISGRGDMIDGYLGDAGRPSWYGYVKQITDVVIEEGVTSIGDHAFDGHNALETITMPEGIRRIGDYAFFCCESLTAIQLPDSLKEIGNRAFTLCAFQELHIPAGVEYIDPTAFRGSDKLTKLTVAADNLYYSSDDFGVLYNKDKTHVVLCIKGATGHCVLANTVTTIADEAFVELAGVTGITIPGGVKEIGTAVFLRCTNLAKVVLSEGLERIGWNAFSYCEALTEITFPTTLTDLGNSFEGNYNLKNFYFTGDAPTMDGMCFNCITATAYYPAGNETWTENKLQNYMGTITWIAYSPEEKLPCENGHHVPGLQFIDKETGFCAYCDAICHTNGTTIWAIESDGDMIIYGTGENGAGQLDYYDYLWTDYLDKIVTLTVEDGVTGFIFNFAECANLKTVYLSDDITQIDKFAFALCSNLEQVNIPSGLTYLGSGAFQECKKLKEVYLPATVTEIGSGVFANCNSLETIQVDENNPYYYTDDRGVLYGAYPGNGICLLAAPGKLSGHYTVSGDAEFILSGVFWGCADLTSVTISEGVQMLDMYVFKDCTSLKSVTFPKSLMEPGYYTFENCTALETVYFEGDAPYWFDSNFFKGVTATAYYPAGNETWTEEIMQNYGGNITWLPFGEVTNSVEWVAANATLTGSIDLNFSAVLSDNLVNEDTFVRFTCAGKTVDVPMSQAVVSVKDGQTRYRFGYKVYAKEMTETVTAQVMTPQGPVGEPKSYSVAEYCNALMAVTNNAEIIAVCKAMLNYGAAAQMQFSYNLDNLANASLSEADKVVAKPDASAYAHKIVGTGDGIKAASAKLTLDADVAIRVTFQITGDKDVSEYQFLIDGEEAAPVADNGRYYIQLDGIAASKFDETHIFSVGDLAVHYSVLSYVNMVHNSNSPENLVNLINALYAYYAATEAYVN